MWKSDEPKYSAKSIERIGDEMWSKAGAEIQEAAGLFKLSLSERKKEPDTKSVEDDMRSDATAIRGFLSFLNRLNLSSLDDRTANVICLWQIEERVGRWKLTELRRLAKSMPLDSLADQLEKEASERVKSGAARVEREWFVRQLAGIWERVYGKQPSKSYTSGPFYRFVIACLEPFDQKEFKGIEGVIRKVTSK